jgi:hypothetical protein
MSTVAEQNEVGLVGRNPTRRAVKAAVHAPKDGREGALTRR